MQLLWRATAKCLLFRWEQNHTLIKHFLPLRDFYVLFSFNNVYLHVLLLSILLFQSTGIHQTLYLHWILYPVWAMFSTRRFPCNYFFSVYSLELDRNCQFDFTAIYDGPTTNTGLIGKVCGLAQPTFESSSNVMTVVLSTDYANSYRGFSAQYTSTPLVAPVEPNSKYPRYMNRMLFLVLTYDSSLPLQISRTDVWY